MAEGDFLSCLEGPLRECGASSPLDFLASVLIDLLTAMGCRSVNGSPVGVISGRYDCKVKHRHTAELVIVSLSTFYICIDCTIQ